MVPSFDITMTKGQRKVRVILQSLGDEPPPVDPEPKCSSPRLASELHRALNAAGSPLAGAAESAREGQVRRKDVARGKCALEALSGEKEPVSVIWKASVLFHSCRICGTLVESRTAAVVCDDCDKT